MNKSSRMFSAIFSTGASNKPCCSRSRRRAANVGQLARIRSTHRRYEVSPRSESAATASARAGGFVADLSLTSLPISGCEVPEWTGPRMGSRSPPAHSCMRRAYADQAVMPITSPTKPKEVQPHTRYLATLFSARSGIQATLTSTQVEDAAPGRRRSIVSVAANPLRRGPIYLRNSANITPAQPAFAQQRRSSHAGESAAPSCLGASFWAEPLQAHSRALLSYRGNCR